MASSEGPAPSDCYNQPSQQSLVLECSVCAENYGPDFDHQPRSLKCGHTFCTKCLMKIMTSKGIKCPMCSQVHLLSSPDVMLLPINYAVQEILKNISGDGSLMNSQQPDRPPCGVCRKPATVICIDCEPGNHFHFCRKCDEEEHGRPFGPVQRHRRFPGEEAPVLGLLTGCVRHPNATVSFYSEALNEFACNLCVAEDDWSIRVVHFKSVSQATKKLQGRVQKLSKHTQDILNRLAGSRQMLEDILSNLEPASLNVKAEINSRFSNLIEALQERQKILLTNVDVEVKNRRQNVETQLQTVISSAVKYRDTFESLNSLITKTDVEFLRMYPSATQNIESVLRSEDKGLLRPVFNQSIPFYLNKDIEKEVRTLGAVGGGVTPTDLDCSSSGSQGTLMELLWQLPEHCGKVNRFQIEYDQMTMERRDSGFLGGGESDALTFTQNEPQFFEVAGSKLNTFMDYLCPGYSYQFRIRSANDAGWGMWSKPVVGECEGFPFALNYTKSIHRIVVPTSSYYRITVKGAKAEDGMVRHGGRGAIISGVFSLKAGDVLILLCGGMSSRHHYHSGGGGGSFVAVNEISQNNLLVVAGGGGGTRGASEEDWNGSDASLTTDGKDGLGEDAGKGGVNGGPGTDSRDKATEGPSFGNGGAGFLHNSSTAMSFLSGGHGGQNGGFGGGGAVGMYGGGGGGGYSGGGGGRGGGGGGSFISPAALDISKEVGNNGHGSIVIEKVMPPYPLAEQKVSQSSVESKVAEGASEAGSNNNDTPPLFSMSSTGTTGSLYTSLSSKALSTGTSVGTIPETYFESPANTSQVMDQSKPPPPTVVSFSVGTDLSSCSENSSRAELGGARNDATDRNEVEPPVPAAIWKPAPELSPFVSTLEDYFGPSQTVGTEASSMLAGNSVATTASTVVRVSEKVAVAPNYELTCAADDPSDLQHKVKELIEFHESLTEQSEPQKGKLLQEDVSSSMQQLTLTEGMPSQPPNNLLQMEGNGNSVRSSTSVPQASGRTLPPNQATYSQQQSSPWINPRMSSSSQVAPGPNIGSLMSEHGPTLQWLLQQQNIGPGELQQKLLEVQMILQAQQQQQQQQQQHPHHPHQQLVIQASGQEELSPPSTQQHPHLATQLQNQQQLPSVVLGHPGLPGVQHNQSFHQQSVVPMQSTLPVQNIQSQQQRQPLPAVGGMDARVVGVRDQGNHSPPLVSQQHSQVGVAAPLDSYPTNGIETEPVQYQHQQHQQPYWNSNH